MITWLRSAFCFAPHVLDLSETMDLMPCAPSLPLNGIKTTENQSSQPEPERLGARLT